MFKIIHYQFQSIQTKNIYKILPHKFTKELWKFIKYYIKLKGCKQSVQDENVNLSMLMDCKFYVLAED